MGLAKVPLVYYPWLLCFGLPYLATILQSSFNLA